MGFVSVAPAPVPPDRAPRAVHEASVVIAPSVRQRLSPFNRARK